MYICLYLYIHCVKYPASNRPQPFVVQSRVPRVALLAAAAAGAGPPAPPHVGPLACQPNEQQPMIPTYHIIGNVTQDADGSVKLEGINDCSGVTYYKEIYHIWHHTCLS